MDDFGMGYALGSESGDRNRDGFLGGEGIWAIIIFAMIFGWGNGGFGGWGGQGAAVQGALTRADLCDGFNFNDIKNGVRGLERGLCDLGYATQAGFGNLGQQIAENRFAAQQCCCETNRNIDAVRYEAAKNTCDIIQAGRDNTQRIIDTLTQDKMQDLRDQLQTANLQLSQQAQSANLIATLRPTPIPSYLTCSPYESAGMYSGFGRVGGCCGC